MPSGHPCYLTIAGERKSVAEWAIIAGVLKKTILARLRKSPGISPSLAVFGEADSRPNRGGRGKQTKITIDGETRTIPAWSQISGTPYRTILSRLQRGYIESAAVFGETFAKDKFATAPRVPVSFPVTAYNRWGGVQSISF